MKISIKVIFALSMIALGSSVTQAWAGNEVFGSRQNNDAFSNGFNHGNPALGSSQKAADRALYGCMCNGVKVSASCSDNQAYVQNDCSSRQRPQSSTTAAVQCRVFRCN